LESGAAGAVCHARSAEVELPIDPCVDDVDLARAAKAAVQTQGPHNFDIVEKQGRFVILAHMGKGGRFECDLSADTSADCAHLARGAEPVVEEEAPCDVGAVQVESCPLPRTKMAQSRSTTAELPTNVSAVGTDLTIAAEPVEHVDTVRDVGTIEIESGALAGAFVGQLCSDETKLATYPNTDGADLARTADAT
jgi:hypothetical protein